MTFWWRRCMEQSRSPRWMTLPWPSAEHLELDVARTLEEFLHVDRIVAERGECFGAGDGDSVQQRCFAVHHAHAAAAAAARTP